VFSREPGRRRPARERERHAAGEWRELQSARPRAIAVAAKTIRMRTNA
jgi:hypothetical protein